jgi:hypothetical protein
MKSISSLLTLVLFFAGCSLEGTSDQAPTLFPETSSGADRTACYVNGEVWNSGVYYYRVGTMDPPSGPSCSLTFPPAGPRLEYYDDRWYRPNESPSGLFFMLQWKGVGIYKIGDGFTAASWEPTLGKNADVLESGFVHVKVFDTVRQVIAGTFDFTVFDTVNNLRYHLSDGRFDAYQY